MECFQESQLVRNCRRKSRAEYIACASPQKHDGTLKRLSLEARGNSSFLRTDRAAAVAKCKAANEAQPVL